MTEPQVKMKANNVAVWAMGFGAFLVSADNRAIAPMLPAITGDFHISPSAAATLITAYSIPYGTFQLMYGPIADRFGKVKVIMIACLLFAIGTVGCGLVQSFDWLLLLRVITAVFAAGIIPTALAHIGDLFRVSERPRVIAFFMSLSTAGQAFGIVIGGIVAQFATYKLLFIVIGLAVLPTLFSLRPGKQQNSEAAKKTEVLPFRKNIVALFTQKRSWLVYGLVFFEGFMFWGGFTFLAVYGNIVLHLSYLVVGLLTATYSLGGFVGSRTISFVLNRMGHSRMPVLGALLMTVAYGLCWSWESTFSLCAGYVILGYGFSYCHSTLQTYATDLLPQGRATAVSVFGFSLYLGGGIGPILIGYIYNILGARAMLGSATLGMGLFCLACLTLLAGSSRFLQTDNAVKLKNP